MILCREQEQAILNKYFKSKRAEFIAVYGRRRIGKTFLIHEFFKDKGIYLEVTGSKKTSKTGQIKNFMKEFRAIFPTEISEKFPKDWSDVFELVQNVAKKIDPSIKFIFFIDELPWFASAKSGFLEALEYSWNRHLSRMPNLLLIICGSAANWMIKKIVNDRGGLHGRLSTTLRMQPFSLRETEQFLADQGVRLKRKHLIELYMAFGGVAKYLIHLPIGQSPSQIINEYCFSVNGSLFSEFIKLYESLFDSAEKHLAIIRALAKNRHGLSQAELLKAVNISRGGSASDVLEELEQSGFIMSIPSFGKQSKEHLYRLTDEYSLFYLTWIEIIQGSLFRNFDREYWNKMCKTPQWYSWAGYAFENICLKHTGKIKEALGLASVTTVESHWQHFASKKGDKGAEIDLVIDRADNCINLCEIKFCNEEFEITPSYAKDLERKKEVFQKITKTRKTLFTTLITPFGVKENEHSIGVVDQQLTLDALY